MPYLYVIVLREFVRSGEQVFKAGRSYDPAKRLKQYAKGSVLLATVQVKDDVLAERHLLKVMDAAHERCPDIGREYYRGDYTSVLDTFFCVAKKYGCFPQLVCASKEAEKEEEEEQEEQEEQIGTGTESSVRTRLERTCDITGNSDDMEPAESIIRAVQAEMNISSTKIGREIAKLGVCKKHVRQGHTTKIFYVGIRTKELELVMAEGVGYFYKFLESFLVGLIRQGATHKEIKCSEFLKELQDYCVDTLNRHEGGRDPRNEQTEWRRQRVVL
jgi:hypothetical protein